MAAKRAREIPSDIPVVPVPMRPGRNGGMLRSGGPNPGAGRPPDEVRALAREGARAAVPKLLAIVRNPKSRQADVVAASAQLLKYGLGVPTQNVNQTGEMRIRVVREDPGPPDAA
jgi:hypothetical protein